MSQKRERKQRLGPVGSARLRSALAVLFFSIGLLGSWELPEKGIFGVPPSGVCFGFGLAVAGVSLALGKRGAAIALCVAVFLMGVGWGILKLRERGETSLGVVMKGEKESRVLRLTLLEPPRRVGADGEAWICLADCRGIVTDSGDIEATGKVWLRSPVDGAALRRAGDRVIARGLFRPVLPPRNPGEFDLERWARDRGIEGSVRAVAAGMVRPDESPAAFGEVCRAWWLRGISSLRSRGNTVLQLATRGASEDTKEVLRGLLLGEDPRSPSDGLRAFYRLGLAHILSISGFHLVVFAGAMLFALRLIGDLGKLEPLLIALAILLFLALVPPSSPLIRAAAILLALLLAEFFGRRYDRLTLLCWVALAVLIVRPSELWSLGFQLSFGLAAALLGLSRKLMERLFPLPLGQRASARGWKRWTVRACQGLFVTGLLCWGISAPWVAAQLGIFNPIAVLTGFLVTPVVAATLWIGYGALLVGMIVPGTVSLAALILTTLSDLCVRTVLWFDSLPGATIRMPWLSAWWAGAATLLLAFWFWRVRLRERWCIALACVLFAWGGLEMAFAKRLPVQVAARIDLLDVDQGSCSVVRGHRATVMIGAGTNSGEGRDLPPIARELGAWRLDALLLLVEDENSTAGAAEVIRSLTPSRIVLVGEGETTGEAWSRVIAVAASYRVPIERGANVHVVMERLGLGSAWEALRLEQRQERNGPGMLTSELLQDGAVRRSLWKRDSRPIFLASQGG